MGITVWIEFQRKPHMNPRALVSRAPFVDEYMNSKLCERITMVCFDKKPPFWGQILFFLIPNLGLRKGAQIQSLMDLSHSLERQAGTIVDACTASLQSLTFQRSRVWINKFGAGPESNFLYNKVSYYMASP